MQKNKDIRSERIELRTKPEVKSIIERAAQLQHTTISAYLIEAALKKAQEDMMESESFVLDQNDRDLFFKLVSSPPKPNAALKSLMKTSK